VFKLAGQNSEPHGLHVTDREGKHQPDGLNLSQIGTGKATMMLGDTDKQRTVRIELKPDGDGGIDGARLLDQWGRVIAERNAPRWLFSAPVLHALVVWGRAQNVVVRNKMVDIGQIVCSESQLKLSGILGLPVRGLHPWHLGMQDRNDGLKRVSMVRRCGLIRWT
jgi:hypothetical protein